MKRFTFLLATVIFSASHLGFSQNLQAEFAMAEFSAPEEGPYLETYLKLKGTSLQLEETEQGRFSEVLITYRVSKGVWVPFKDAYKVRGPLNELGELPLDFIDQRRIPLKPGEYQLEVTIDDLKDSTELVAKVSQTLIIEKNLTTNLEADKADSLALRSPVSKPYYKTLYALSGIQLVDTYAKTTNPNILSKAGFDLIPYTSDFYPNSKNELIFYAEVYSTHNRDIVAGSKFLIDAYIENADDGKPIQGLRKFLKREDAKVSPVLQTFPIDQLPSGNYNLVVEVKDDKNRIMDRKYMFFQRMNDMIDQTDYVLKAEGDTKEFYGSWVTQYQDLDALKEYLRCLHPISSQEEIAQVNTRMNFKDRNMMQEFMYYFWKQRDPLNPEGAWLKYWTQVEKVNATYTNNLNKGYDTDRGRVYLQYGPPNTISPNYFEPNTYPYEIWHYYVLKDHKSAEQSNRKFIFANIDQGTKEFRLIHSDAKNEITNARWHHELHSRSTQSINLDVEDSGDHFGGRSKDFFQNPY